MADSFLNISQSLNKARWELPDAPIERIERLVRAHNLPEIIARFLIGRSVPDDEIESFLNPTLKSDFPSPFSMAGMEKMALDVVEAIDRKVKMAIFGDFDVDGATSSAVLHRFLKHCGIHAQIYIPERLTEGYGPNKEALDTLRQDGVQLLFMLDCGSTAFDVIQHGSDIGLDIIILDHHECEADLPAAKHVINPKRKDDTSQLDMLAAVGVTFMACVAINNKLREAGFFEKNGIEEAPLKEWLDLVALGTVCDMVPLSGLNRLLVRLGFKVMQMSSSAGLKALIEVAGISGDINTFHAGFVIGPRINAGSRVYKSDLGATLLAIDDGEEARNIAFTLDDCNEKRKSIQEGMEHLAIQQVEREGLESGPVILVDHKDWHQGLSGLVAGRLKEKYGVPACVMTHVESGDGAIELRGSGRSVPGIHIAQAFIDARNEGLLEKGGGHAMAGGFTLLPEKLDAFKAFVSAHIEKQMANTDMNVITSIDGVLSVRGASVSLVKMVQDQLGPFGQDFPEPLFVFSNVRLHSVDVVGEKHIRAMISDWEGGARMKAMAFRSVGTDLGDALLKQGRQPFHLLGTLKIDNWGGREKVEMHIKDAAFAMEQGDSAPSQKEAARF